MSRGLERLWRHRVWLAAAAALWIALSTLFFVERYRFVVPLTDQWDEVTWQRRYDAGKVDLGSLWRQHNEHRLVLARLVFLADARFFEARNGFSIAAILLLQALFVALLARHLRSDSAGLGQRQRALLAWAAAAMLASAFQLINFVWAFGVQHVLVLGSACAACLAVGRAARPEAGRGWLVLALLAQAAAVLSAGSGVFLGAVLVAMAALAGRRRLALLLGGSTLLWALLYFRGYGRPARHSGLEGSLEGGLGELLELPGRLLLLLGAPFSLSDGPVGTAEAALAVVVGALGLALFAGVLWLLLRRPPEMRRRALALAGFGAFTLLSLVAVVFARRGFPVEVVLDRKYATTVFAFWAATPGALLALLGPAERPALRRSVEGLVLGLVVLLAAHQLDAARHVGRYVETIRRAGVALALDLREPGLEHWLCQKPKGFRKLARYLERERLSIYGEPWVKAQGQPISSLGPIAPEDCAGEITGLEPLPGAVPGAVEVSGTAAASETLLLADQDGVVRGAARRDVSLEHAGERWHGYARLGAGARSLSAYAWLPGGELCRVGATTVAQAVTAGGAHVLTGSPDELFAEP